MRTSLSRSDRFSLQAYSFFGKSRLEHLTRDAVRAAGDVIALSAKLQPGRPLSSKALLELMTDLADLGASGDPA